VFRVLQGLSGGGMPPSEQAILADTFRPDQWRCIFFINLPSGLMSLALVHWLLIEPTALEERRELLREGMKIELCRLDPGCAVAHLPGDRSGRSTIERLVLVGFIVCHSAGSLIALIPWKISRITRRRPPS